MARIRKAVDVEELEFKMAVEKRVKLEGEVQM
jgi:hypothetical protein